MGGAGPRAQAVGALPAVLRMPACNLKRHARGRLQGLEAGHHGPDTSSSRSSKSASSCKDVGGGRGWAAQQRPAGAHQRSWRGTASAAAPLLLLSSALLNGRCADRKKTEGATVHRGVGREGVRGPTAATTAAAGNRSAQEAASEGWQPLVVQGRHGDRTLRGEGFLSGLCAFLHLGGGKDGTLRLAQARPSATAPQGDLLQAGTTLTPWGRLRGCRRVGRRRTAEGARAHPHGPAACAPGAALGPREAGVEHGGPEVHAGQRLVRHEAALVAGNVEEQHLCSRSGAGCGPAARCSPVPLSTALPHAPDSAAAASGAASVALTWRDPASCAKLSRGSSDRKYVVTMSMRSSGVTTSACGPEPWWSGDRQPSGGQARACRAPPPAAPAGCPGKRASALPSPLRPPPSRALGR